MNQTTFKKNKYKIYTGNALPTIDDWCITNTNGTAGLLHYEKEIHHNKTIHEVEIKYCFKPQLLGAAIFTMKQANFIVKGRKDLVKISLKSVLQQIKDSKIKPKENSITDEITN